MLTAKSLKAGYIEIRQPNTYCQFKLFHSGNFYHVEKYLRTNETYKIDNWQCYKKFSEAKQCFLAWYESYKP